MAKSSKSTSAARPSPNRRRAERTQPSKVNDSAAELETVTARPAARAAASGNGEWTPPWDEVARRAYEIFLQRGSAPGRDVEDWLEAERQVRASHGR
jgi:Protein of unknown function (DUF2934)